MAAYNAFVIGAGAALHDYATWMAIAESRHEWAWQMWPATLQDPAAIE